MREARISIVNTRRAACADEDNEAVLARARERIGFVSLDRPDLILMAETFGNPINEHNVESVGQVAQSVPGPISEELAALARKCQTYIAFGLHRRDGGRIFNSLVLLDRDGRHVWTYDKVTPVVFEMEDCGITPGEKPTSFPCDFGRIGGAVCFDINFLELAEIYSRQETELILFPSVFPAGRLLDIWSVRYGFAIAASTWYDNNRIIECAGATVGRTSDLLSYTTAVLNLDRRVVHMDGNLDKLDRMRTKYAGDVLIEDLRDEATCVVTSLKKGLGIAELIREFDVETLPTYLDRSRRVREEHGDLALPKWH